MNNLTLKTPGTKGAALLLFVVFFVMISLALVLTIGRGVYDDLASYRSLAQGKQSFYAAEAGIEDAVYRIRNGDNYSSSESFTFNGVSAAVTRTISGDEYRFAAAGNAFGAVRQSEVVLVVGAGVSFGFGIQTGNGGFSLANSSKVYGNVFSNGPVTGSGNNIYGDVISAGPTGLINSIHATGSAWSHSLNTVTIDRDAYYYATATRVATVVGGTSFPGSPDQATNTMPIPDTIIDGWKANAEAGGTLPLASCSGGLPTGLYIIDTNQTIGPLKIPCNLEISKNSTVLTLAGPVWVEGNITTQNGPTIQADPANPDKGAVMIADKVSNRTTSSKVIIQGSTGYTGGAGDSYMLMISMNNSASLGGTEVAMDVDNNTPGSEREVIYYAPYGKIMGRNSLLLRGATAYTISLANSAAVYYEEGLRDPLFTGSGGGYTIDSWKEVE